MKVLYFTATGNCLYVAKSFGGETYSIPTLLKKEEFTIEDDVIGIVFPVYNIGVPKLVEEFLDKAKLKAKYLFAIPTYGMYAGGVTRHLLEIGKRNNIQFSYINELVMVDNFLPGFEMKNQVETLGKKNVEENLNKINQDIKMKRLYLKKHSILVVPLKQMFSKLNHDDFEKNFYTEDSCNGCKTCEKVCPVNNITVDKKPVFNQNCQHCLACIQNCPKKAIHHKKEKSSERFRNEHISLKEIVNANE